MCSQCYVFIGWRFLSFLSQIIDERLSIIWLIFYMHFTHISKVPYSYITAMSRNYAVHILFLTFIFVFLLSKLVFLISQYCMMNILNKVHIINETWFHLFKFLCLCYAMKLVKRWCNANMSAWEHYHRDSFA